MTNIIITRHKGLIKWLKIRGIEGKIIFHVTSPEQIRNKNVFGILPLNLASLTRTLTSIDMPNIKPEQRGKDLSPQEMDSAGAVLHIYEINLIA